MALVQFHNVTFSYDEVNVLEDVSFSIEDGECVALIGPNGAGKSTVAELICALLIPDSGTVTAFGIDTSTIDNNSKMLELRSQLGYAQQNPDEQFVEPMVLDEVAFGPSNLSLPKEEVFARVESALAQTDAIGLLKRNVNSLSGGEKQRIAIADALAMNPSLLILDEPTSMLDPSGRKDVISVIEQAKSDGRSILLLTHSIEEAALANRVLRIEHGKILESSIREMVEEHEKQRAGLQQSIADREVDDRLAGRITETTPRPPIIQVEGVSYAYDSTRSRIMEMFAGNEDDRSSSKGIGSSVAPLALESISLEVMPGETLAIKGPNGCGKSTLLQLMNGLLKPTDGKVLVQGVDTSTKTGANSARRTVGLCGQFPERTFFAQTAREEITFGPKNLGHTASQIKARVDEASQAVGIDKRILDASPFELSGGEQRKVAIASVLALEPTVLLLDEPCSGLDIESHTRILETLIGLKAQGTTIVFVSHDDHDIELLADRVHDIQDGKA